MNTNYLVKIEIEADGYEKHSHILVTNVPNKDEKSAFEYACILEGHNHLWKEAHRVIDGSYEFIYSPCKVQEVSEDDLPILSKYFEPWEFNLEAVECLRAASQHEDEEDC